MNRRFALKSAAALGLATLVAACGTGETNDIVDIASSNPDFSTLVAAVAAADLVDVLKSDGPFTVFAPTNDAFAALPEGTVESLLLPENKDQLTQILTYHVVPGVATASDLVGMQGTIGTVEGSSLSFNGGGGSVTVGDATVVTPDIQADNGVIHVIDTVLLP
ncbi:MAG: fasciclin domain-containing protein [Pseudomonadota bacterium]